MSGVIAAHAYHGVKITSQYLSGIGGIVPSASEARRWPHVRSAGSVHTSSTPRNPSPALVRFAPALVLANRSRAHHLPNTRAGPTLEDLLRHDLARRPADPVRRHDIRIGEAHRPHAVLPLRDHAHAVHL